LLLELCQTVQLHKELERILTVRRRKKKWEEREREEEQEREELGEVGRVVEEEARDLDQRAF
jgi:hypothetical protein